MSEETTPQDGKAMSPASAGSHWHITWRDAAMRLGERLEPVGPLGYYSMSAGGWLQWAAGVVLSRKPTLTDEEREAVDRVRIAFRDMDHNDMTMQQIEDYEAICDLLQRTK